ncbi:MAG: hypothetical protein HWD86_01735 [Kangiellaceae bacterium]|nr:hypothetical protein [Kangiellaceae bacterium]
MSNKSAWVAKKLSEDENNIKVVETTAEDFLVIDRKDGNRFIVAVLGLKGIIRADAVRPLFSGENKPQLVINVPSNILWSGSAIDYIHSNNAAFGKMGDIYRSARVSNVGDFRDKNMGFFINAMQQHSNVRSVSYVYDTVFQVNRLMGNSLIVAVVEAYNMSAEDVRNARARFGNFDIVVKSTSYGSITKQAEEAARSMGAKALTFRGLLGCLAS